jgi:hypothetical protein
VVAYTASDNVVTRRIGGETILVPICGGVGDLEGIYTLDEVGSAIWETVAGGADGPQIVARLTREYEVTAEAAERDVREFLSALEAAGLVRRGGAG